MEYSINWNKRVVGLPLRDWILVVFFYLIFGFAYFMAIYTTSGGQSNFVPNIFIDYGLKGLFTLPVWWLLFRKIKHWQIWQKVLLHLIICPIYVIGWQQTYYAICDSLDMWHLGWPGAWWDIYIPGLFYVLQFGIFHVYDFYNELQEKEKLESELREVALRSELIALKAQLNPHFLYNTFNTISASVPAQQENTRELIALLSDLFRYQLKGSKVDQVPLKDELEFIETYLQLEKARFQDRLEYSFIVPEELLEAKVPPMILQPIIENAIKHGIAPKLEGGKISLEVKQKADMIHFTIEDSGVGYDPEKAALSNGLGLSNTKKRLTLSFGTELLLETGKEGGLKVSFQIPSTLELTYA